MECAPPGHDVRALMRQITERNRTAEWIKAQISNPRSHNPNTVMPAFDKLGPTELGTLAQYLLSLKPEKAAASNDKKEAGAAAAVLPSLFEEQIAHDEIEMTRVHEFGTDSFAEALTYFPEEDDYHTGPDAYLELMQNLADIAFMLLLDTGLAASGDRKTLAAWKQMGKKEPDALASRIGDEWMDNLMLPEIPYTSDPILFSQQHNELLQEKLQLACGNLQTEQELHEASVLTMAMALHLARGLGANPQQLSEHWINIAKENGALD